ncbi:MAG: CapA family protein [Lachnospiraceae bacterium]|nr:CapA family protein [Lachnospiraceae bacterium]
MKNAVNDAVEEKGCRQSVTDMINYSSTNPKGKLTLRRKISSGITLCSRLIFVLFATAFFTLAICIGNTEQLRAQDFYAETAGCEQSDNDVPKDLYLRNFNEQITLTGNETGTAYEQTAEKKSGTKFVTKEVKPEEKTGTLPRYKKDDGIWRLKNQKNNGEKDDSDETTAVLMFAGDLMCLKGQQYDASGKKGFDFSPSFKYVTPLFKRADLVCGNLETLLSESNPLTMDQVYENNEPQCNGPVEYLKALKKAGIDMVATANNHTCDWGAVGITETKKHLDDFGLANIGTHYNETDPKKAGERYAIFNVKGIRVAVLSYTHIINQRGKMIEAEMATMVHLFDRDTVKKDIGDARKDGAEFVVVYLHQGIENTENLTQSQIDDSEFVAEAGADLIIGSHPHCLQKCTYIKTSDGRKVLCMYSMGNFVSSMAREINNDTIILRVEIKKTTEKNGTKVEMSGASYIPCNVQARDGHSFVVFPTSKKLNGGVSSASLKNATKRIAGIMGGVISPY